MPLLILLAIATIVSSTYLALQSRRPAWRRAAVVYTLLAGANLVMALNLLTAPQPVRTIAIALLLIGTLFLLPSAAFAIWRRAGRPRS